MPRRFRLVDVFARRKYAGNQLCVVTDGPEEGSWPVRIFTPTAEVPFAGHPTLGTAAVIRDHLADGQPDTDQVDPSIPVQVVSTGLPAIIVPLVDRTALEAIDLDRRAYDALVADREAKLVHAFCAEPRAAEHDLAARMFAPHYGVPEDPATGSANGCLAGSLSHHEYFGGTAVDVHVEQGYEMDRPSLISLEADTNEAGGVDVAVGGRVVPVARGHLL